MSVLHVFSHAVGLPFTTCPLVCACVPIGWVEGALNQSGLSLPQEHEFGEDSELVDIANKIKALSMSDSESDVREGIWASQVHTQFYSYR